MATTSPKKREEKPWKRPGRRRVRALRERLREMYGVPVNEPNRKPIDELVLTILSQHTNDRNSGRAFKLLRERFPKQRTRRACEGRRIPRGRVLLQMSSAGRGRQSRKKEWSLRMCLRLLCPSSASFVDCAVTGAAGPHTAFEHHAGPQTRRGVRGASRKLIVVLERVRGSRLPSE